MSEILYSLAGRIKIEKYYPAVRDIINLLTKFHQSKQHFDLKPEQEQSLGTVSFDFQGRPVSIDVVAVCSPDIFFEAGFSNPLTTGDKPILAFNFWDKRFDSYINILPLIQHELTHYLEALHSPVYQKRFAPGEINTDDQASFYDTFLKAFLHSPDKKMNIDFGDAASLNAKNLEQAAIAHTLRFIKTKPAKELFKQFGITLNKEILGKLIRLVEHIYIEAVNTYMNTGGDFFGTKSTKDPEVAKIRDESAKIYYNTRGELSAYLNQIISEITSADKDGSLIRTITEVTKGKTSLGPLMPAILARSKTFQGIKDKLTPANLQAMLREIGKYLIDYSRRKTDKEKQQHFGLNLTPQEELMARHLLRLYDRHSPKLDELLNDPAFVQQHRPAITYVMKQLETQQKIQYALQELDKISPPKTVAAQINNYAALVKWAADHIPNFTPQYKAGDLLKSTKYGTVYAVFIKYEFSRGNRYVEPDAVILLVQKDEEVEDVYYSDQPLFTPGSFGGPSSVFMPLNKLTKDFTFIASKGDYTLYVDDKAVSSKRRE